MAKIWIEENGEKKIEISWSELSAEDNKDIIEVIEKYYDAINDRIDNLFKGKKVDILKINKRGK